MSRDARNKARLVTAICHGAISKDGKLRMETNYVVSDGACAHTRSSQHVAFFVMCVACNRQSKKGAIYETAERVSYSCTTDWHYPI